MSEQFMFDFQAAPHTKDALTVWRETRAREAEKLCLRLGLPIGASVEVRFKNGTILRGLLRLAEESLWMDEDRRTVVLQIEEATFRIAEIAAAVRIDGGGICEPTDRQ